MFWLIEEESQLNTLINSGHKEAFIEIIPYNNNIHPVLNNISLIYIRPITDYKGYIICINHTESLLFLKTSNDILIQKLLNKFNKLYCRDKKELLHYYPINNLYDINISYKNYNPIKTRIHEIFYNKYGNLPNINLIIPVVKHYEYCESIFQDLKQNIEKPQSKYDGFFNNKTTLVFNYIERNGIHINKQEFSEYFYDIENEFTFTQFNIKTLTTRPSNKFGCVNYAALNKTNGCRKSFIPSNDFLLEIDISAFHPTLCCRLIDYKFEDMDNIHYHLSQFYDVDYQTAKELTFKQLYGGVFNKYKDVEFFKKIQIYVNELWNKFNKDGYIEVPISKHRIKKEDVIDINPQKLFNYLLQGYETSQNIIILWDIIKILINKKTKIILYTYDSFTLDVNNEESHLIEEIRNVFKKYKLKIKEVKGLNYNEMI